MTPKIGDLGGGQVATQLRPVLIPAETFRLQSEKRFFIEHFASCFGGQSG